MFYNPKNVKIHVKILITHFKSLLINYYYYYYYYYYLNINYKYIIISLFSTFNKEKLHLKITVILTLLNFPYHILYLLNK